MNYTCNLRLLYVSVYSYSFEGETFMPQISNLKVNPYAFTATHFRQGALRTINSTRLLKLLERVLSYLG